MTVAVEIFHHRLENTSVRPRRCDADECGQDASSTMWDSQGCCVELCQEHWGEVDRRRKAHYYRLQQAQRYANTASSFRRSTASTWTVYTV